MNGIFEDDTKLAPRGDPSVGKNLSHKPWCLNSRKYLIQRKNLKWKWVVLYGIEVPKPYGFDEATLAEYELVSTTKHQGQRNQGEEELNYEITGEVNLEATVCIQCKL